MAFTPSRIGTYWLNDLDSDTEIDVVAVDHQHKLVFAGECKYHDGLFSKSGFTKRILELARENPQLLLINEDRVVG